MRREPRRKKRSKRGRKPLRKTVIVLWTTSNAFPKQEDFAVRDFASWILANKATGHVLETNVVHHAPNDFDWKDSDKWPAHVAPDDPAEAWTADACVPTGDLASRCHGRDVQEAACPSCGGTDVYHCESVEEIRTVIGLADDGTLLVSGHVDETFTEGARNERLWCRSCFFEWPLPENLGYA